MEVYYKTGFIFICLAVNYILYLTAKKRNAFALGGEDGFFLLWAFVFTFASDYMLLARQSYTKGVFLFCFVQLMYLVRYGGFQRKLLWLGLTLIPAGLCYLVTDYNVLGFLGALYGQWLMIAVILSVRAFLKKRYPFPNNYMVLAGMLLFLLCDINIGFGNVWRVTGKIHSFHNTAILLAWLFYAPAQALLCISAFGWGGKKTCRRKPRKGDRR